MEMDIWLVARTAFELFVALSIKTYIENGQVNWKTFNKAYVTWSTTPADAGTTKKTIEIPKKVAAHS